MTWGQKERLPLALWIGCAWELSFIETRIPKRKDFLLVIDFYHMWWLLKEPFLATYSAMSNLHSTKQGAVASKRAVVQYFVAAP